MGYGRARPYIWRCRSNGGRPLGLPGRDELADQDRLRGPTLLALTLNFLQLMKIREQVVLGETGQKLRFGSGIEPPDMVDHVSLGHNLQPRAPVAAAPSTAAGEHRS